MSDTTTMSNTTIIEVDADHHLNHQAPKHRQPTPPPPLPQGALTKRTRPPTAEQTRSTEHSVATTFTIRTPATATRTAHAAHQHAPRPAAYHARQRLRVRHHLPTR
jgi:hypothetical protein